MAKVIKDTPLSELTLRKYEKPFDLTGRPLYKKLCLSLGLLQPGDSRDVMVDVLMVMAHARKERKMLTSDEVRERVITLRKQEGLQLLGIAGSNIRRQLKRLRDLFIIEKIMGGYRLTEFLPLSAIFKDKIGRYLLPSLIERLEEYLSEADAQ